MLQVCSVSQGLNTQTSTTTDACDKYNMQERPKYPAKVLGTQRQEPLAKHTETNHCMLVLLYSGPEATPSIATAAAPGVVPVATPLTRVLILGLALRPPPMPSGG